jgi:Fe-S-cluster containining protein
MASKKHQYDCVRCPAYCCTYAEIGVTARDIDRLAKHFGIAAAAAEKKFTKPTDDGKKRMLRHRRDEHFGTACRFLDRETRACTVYKSRPQICRDFPSTYRCGYYEFLKFERYLLDDPEHVATTWSE